MLQGMGGQQNQKKYLKEFTLLFLPDELYQPCPAGWRNPVFRRQEVQETTPCLDRTAPSMGKWQ